MLLLLALLASADATTWSPLRIALDCQTSNRVNACTYVQGLLQAEPLFLVVPRAEAQVVLYLNVTERANDDLVLLRAVGDLPGAPETFEQLAEVNTREDVDVQREALSGPMNRVLAPFLMVAVPGAVTVDFAAPAAADAVPPKTTPFGASVYAGGWGSWSPNYQSLSAWGGANAWRITNDRYDGLWVSYNRDISRQPSLEVGGDVGALTSDSESISAGWTSTANVSEHWAIASMLRGGHDDKQGQFLGTTRLHVGVERDWYASDDPRGNVLAVAWLVGEQLDWYNRPNVLGETNAKFPTQALLGSGSVVFDAVQLDVDLALQAELFHPLRRYQIRGGTSADFTLGDHLDLGLQLYATQQALPGPADIDTSNFEEVTRASYAEPFSVDANLEFNIHFDNTNSARNNRFDSTSLSATGNL